MTNDELLDAYAPKLAVLLPLARCAYGARDTDSPQHRASRMYTALLCEFYKEGGSLLDLAARLGVTYASLHRRVATAKLSTRPSAPRVKFSDEQYAEAAELILEAKMEGTTEYHQCLKKHYEERYSMARLAREMGLSSANPLYYGVNRARLDETA